MSVAIDNSVDAQFNKEAYDSEFSIDALIPESKDGDVSEPVELCAITCTLSCAATISI